MFAPKIIKNLSVLLHVTIDNVGGAFWRIFIHFNSYFVVCVFPR